MGPRIGWRLQGRWLRQNRPEPDSSLLQFRHPNRLDHYPLHFVGPHQGVQDNRKLHGPEYFVFQEIQKVLLCACVIHHSFTRYNPCPTFSILSAVRSRSRAFCSCVPVNSVSFPRIWSRDSTPPLRTFRICCVVSVLRPSG